MAQSALIFPGQGSQSVGMMDTLAGAYPQIKETFVEAADVLGYDLWTLVQAGPEDQLNSTEFTQPALLTGSVAMWRVLNAQHPLSPSFLAGHSLGEYSALTCAGVFEFADALRIVRDRGRFMQQAVAEGDYAMAAVLGLADEATCEICETVSKPEHYVAAVNFNTPGQVVIAGHTVAVEKAIEQCKTAGAKMAKRLPVSVPSHCALMQPAAWQLQAELDKLTLSPPKFPVLNNVDVRIEMSPESIKAALIKQLYSPVRWARSIRDIGHKGVTDFYECGPGAVLSRMGKRIDKSLRFHALSDLAVMTEFLKEPA